MGIKKKIVDKLCAFRYPEIFSRNIILMESNPDFSDNARGVFDELIRRNINKDYKIIWMVRNPKEFEDVKIKNVKFYGRNRNYFEKIRFLYYNLFSKYILDSNTYIRKLQDYQFRIHLCHGVPIKVVTDYNSLLGDVDYLIQTTHFFDDYNAKSFNVDKEKILDLGFSRNDELFNEANKDLILFPDIKRKKTIMWMPTYRNHKSGTWKEDGMHSIDFKYGVPSIDNEEQLDILNKLLNKYEILILIKPHPAEDCSIISKLSLSNIKLIDDLDITSGHRNLYQFLGNIDGLITDYSSIYYDFLLTKKPICMLVSDKEQYMRHTKLFFENMEEDLPGEYAYSFDGLLRFIENFANGIDNFYDKRMEKLKIYHTHNDGKSAQRIVDLFMKEIERKK